MTLAIFLKFSLLPIPLLQWTDKNNYVIKKDNLVMIELKIICAQFSALC